MGSVYRSNNADYSVVDSLMAKTAGVRVSAHVPAVSVAHKQNSVIRLGQAPAMVQPVWQAVTIIVDEYGELAGKGEIEVTAVLGMNTKILRADGFLQATESDCRLTRHAARIRCCARRTTRAASGDTPARLVGTLLPIGRVAIDRQEIFTSLGRCSSLRPASGCCWSIAAAK